MKTDKLINVKSFPFIMPLIKLYRFFGKYNTEFELNIIT